MPKVFDVSTEIEYIYFMRIGEAVKAWRWKHEESLRSCAKTIGINHNALLRLESGEEISEKSFAAVLRWLLS
jgi:hypothetical protein